MRETLQMIKDKEKEACAENNITLKKNNKCAAVEGLQRTYRFCWGIILREPEVSRLATTQFSLPCLPACLLDGLLH